jgi:hypothetical protein
MNLEQAIKRTEAVIGLPISKRGGQCYTSWSVLTIVDDGIQVRVSKRAASILMLDTQMPCNARTGER